ncbi:similar to Saccharomyces cerevisiae YDR379W RGA2 GTPase-activating protein for the polarity-establishment protein Cdc42p [Maudiozyma saulgeensis]|uniref:Similar to Saccharomyces cerevisiae YDR379W RGA2 GTPase-activating protein for the polarity-establishment protein Cdc42p n=1 Tax=Maudiozyma saulgeensis TaxID=1789683 RepID=A0A1X7R1V3_9SACH|nr:similar to Saccharomyces cerevisiae YDR379W RGA2 GTPase-activating protein for the polarity-establishment protein Cdc42p [Kazachstania saulgeensis]
MSSKSILEQGNQQSQPQYVCIKCNKQIQSGNFYTINNFHYHNDCFHCFKCQKMLAPHATADSNDKLLVLENGTLICSDCSDSCKRCGKKIYDLAIILSNNEAYCPECFRCTKCDKEITDLKYAKTKNGIFCVDCHQILLQKRRLTKEKLLNKQKNDSTIDSIEIPIRSPSRNKNRDNPIYSKIPNTLPKLVPKTSSPSSSSVSIISSMVSAQSITSNRTTNSTADGFSLKEQTSLKKPPTLVKDQTFSTLKGVPSTYEDAESKQSTEYLDLESKAGHTRNVSIDDMLNATLDHDEEFKDSDENEDHDSIDEDEDEGEQDATDRSFLHYTPVKHNMESIFSENSLIDTYDRESISRTPEPARIIEQVVPELPTSRLPDIELKDTRTTPKLLATPSSKNALSNIPLNSPMAIDSKQTGEAKGLALDLPMFSFEDKDLYYRNNKSSGGNTDTGIPNLKESLQQVFSGAHDEKNNSNYNNGKPNFADDDDDDKIIQITKDNNILANSSPQSAHKNKKLNRSFSLRNNKFFNGFRNKSSESPKNIALSPNTNNMHGAIDTHSGWGVSNNNTSRIVSGEKPRNSFKGSSDTLIYHRHKNDTDIYNTSNGPISISSPVKVEMSSSAGHARSQSTASQSSQVASNIAMFRTPPLDNNAIFKRGGTLSSTSTDHNRSKSYDASSQAQRTISKEIAESANTTSTEPIYEDDGNVSSQSPRDIDSNKIAAHHRSISWQTALHFRHKSINEIDENIDPTELPLQSQTSLANKRPSSRGELLNYEIKLRNSKLELKSIENSKQQLLLEIENLEQYKKNLIHDIDQLKRTNMVDDSNFMDNVLPSTIRSSGHSRTNSSTNNDMNVSNISTPIMYSTSSPQSTSKQKFWKIFGKESNGNHQRNKNSTPLNFSNSSGNLQDSINSNNSNDMNLKNNHAISPNQSNISGLQEIVLTDLCRYENTAVPHLITTCIDFIESDDELLQVEGIYRKSGSQIQIETIEKEFYGINNNINYKFPNDIDINVVTNILKRFLRNLKNPVITFELYDTLINFVKDNNMIQKLSFNDNQLKNHDIQLVKFINGRLQSLLFQQMPREHLNLLQILITHVNKIAYWKDENLMSLHNLSLVFTPSLIHDLNFERDIIDMKERNYLIEYIFTYKIIV